MSFTELGLSQKVLQAVEASGYTTPTPIQAQSIPLALSGRDILGIAQTGTGKTAAFVLPMLSRLEQGRARARMPRTLILEPTRELAAQVEESFIKYGANHKLNVALLIGGVSFGDQEAKITRGVDVLIATPGRLLDFFERGKLLLNGIEILVIDEADRMLDMGFIPDIERICKLVPFTRQTLFFSATMPPEITRLTEAFLHNPARIEVARAASTATTIEQGLVASHGGGAKRETLRRLIRDAGEFKNAIIFCNRKRDVAILHKSLVTHGFSAGALHGDMDQRARMASLDAFKNGDVKLIVCSDVAARGLDIPEVSHVFNFDMPTHSEDYVHRIGRTGRAGRSGTAYSIVTSDDRRYIGDIEKLIGRKIDWFGANLDEIGVDDGASERPHRGRGHSPERGSERSSGRSRGGRAARPPRAAADSVSEAPLVAAADALPSDVSDAPAQRRSRRNGGRASGELRRNAEHAPPAPSHERAAAPEALRPEAAHAVAEPRRSRERSSRGDRNLDRNPERGHAGRDRHRAPENSPETSAAQLPPVRMGTPIDARPRRDDNDGPPVVGLGDHIPGFLLRPATIKPRTAKETAE